MLSTLSFQELLSPPTHVRLTIINLKTVPVQLNRGKQMQLPLVFVIQQIKVDIARLVRRVDATAAKEDGIKRVPPGQPLYDVLLFYQN